MPVDRPSSESKPASQRSLDGTVYLTRRAHFNAAHRLFNPDFDAAWNEKHFGLCSNPRWHGHNYVIEVTVKGKPHPETGYVINLTDLKRVVHEAVVEPCDHRNLNEEVPFLQGLLPSTENLVIAFWNQIETRLGAGKLYRIRLYETENNFAEYLGPLAS